MAHLALGNPVQYFAALKADSARPVPSAPSRALSPALLPHLPPLPSTYSPVQPREQGGGVGAQGLRGLNRDPSAQPGLAKAETSTHHGDGTGMWGAGRGARKTWGEDR